MKLRDLCQFDITRLQFRIWDEELEVMVYVPSHELAKLRGEQHIMQCTGLTDENSELVYEGDLVSFSDEGGSQKMNIAVIHWDNDGASFEVAKLNEDMKVYSYESEGIRGSADMKVIGNVFEGIRKK
jgi:uncharacterized phage protein (TIGR01671 family)